jgi:hypothetical protein
MDGGEMGSREAARRGARTGGSSKLLEKTRRQATCRNRGCHGYDTSIGSLEFPTHRPDGDTLELIVAWPQTDLHHARVRVPYTTRRERTRRVHQASHQSRRRRARTAAAAGPHHEIAVDELAIGPSRAVPAIPPQLVPLRSRGQRGARRWAGRWGPCTAAR